MQTPGLSRYTLFSQGIFVDPMSPTGRLQALANKHHPLVSNFPLIRMGSNADGGKSINAGRKTSVNLI